MSGLSLPSLLATVGLWAVSSVLLAQPAEPTWKPSLGEAFPLGLKDGRVVLTESVLVTPLQILPEGTIARKIFLVPDARAIQQAVRKKKTVELEQTYGGKQNLVSAIDPEADPRNNFEKAVDKLAEGESWNQTEKFAAFFHVAPVDSYYFAYQSNPNSPPNKVQFRPPEQLFLSETGGVVKIRAIGVGSAAEKAGLPGGVELVRVGTSDLLGSLKNFIKFYPLEKEKAQLDGRPLALVYRTIPGGELQTASLRVPISLKSQAGLFDDIPLDSQPATPKDPAPAQEPGNPLVETLPPGAP